MMLDWVYRSVVALRNSMFDHELIRARRLAWPVISVGNLSVGGSGKTPFVIMLGRLLEARGFYFDVLSRGYKRSTKGVLAVDPQGFADRFGDEPLLIARKLHCPVIVGEDRFDAGLEAEEHRADKRGFAVHLLDDGFQHRQLHRDFNIVLLSREDLSDKLLPRGRLREPLTALKRAHAVVVEKGFPRTSPPPGDFQVWEVERQLEIPQVAGPVVAFCGIARPHRFFDGLRRSGLELREEVTFPNHHRYTDEDVRRLAGVRDRNPGSCLLTTEKDAVNLGNNLASLDARTVPVEVKLADPEGALDFVLKTVQS